MKLSSFAPRLFFFLSAFFSSVPAHAANPLKYTAPTTQLSSWTVEVSSRLVSQGSNSYGPANLLDGAETAWVEGAKGDGVGEWVRISQADGKETMKFQSVLVWNGYQKNQKSFEENGRVKDLLVSWAGGSEKIHLRDGMGEQTVRLQRPVVSPWVKFEILSVYPGSKFSDTAISGIAVDLEELNYSQETAPSATQDFSRLLVGRWQSARHIKEFRADGTFCLDPEPGQWTPLGTWQVRGDTLVCRWNGDARTESDTLLSIDKKTLVIRSSAGKEYTLSRVP